MPFSSFYYAGLPVKKCTLEWESIINQNVGYFVIAVSKYNIQTVKFSSSSMNHYDQDQVQSTFDLLILIETVIQTRLQ